MKPVQKITLMVVLLIIATYAKSSDMATVSSKSKIIKKVLMAAEKYASSISCDNEVIKPSDILALHPYKPDDFDTKYLVFWHGDLGCSGGSGTYSANVALVRVGSFGSFFVDPFNSSPIITMDFNTRFLQRLVGNTENTITVDAAEFAEKDSNSYASLNFRYTLRVDDKGNWKLLSKKPLSH